MSDKTVMYKMSFMRTFLFLLLMAMSTSIFGQALTGKITDEEGNTMPFVSVMEEEDSRSTSSNFDGFYHLKLSSGSHTITFSYLGYEVLEKSVKISNELKELNVVLVKSTVELKEAEVVADSRDRAREIMRSVREARRSYLNSIDDFSVRAYQNIVLESKLQRPSKSDSAAYELRKSQGDKAYSPFEKSILEITEQLSDVYYKRPGKYKEVISGVKTYDEFEINARGGKISDHR